MKRAQRTTRKSLDRKLLYAVILVTIVLAALLAFCYLYLQSLGEEWTATLVDQLAVEASLFNPEFKDTSTQLLTSSGFEVAYYSGEDVTIHFYEELPSKGKKILLVRAHSAVRSNTTNVDLFTSEIYEESLAYGAYADLVVNKHISRASFNIPPYRKYFAIGPSFVSSVVRGSFADGLIVLMGCNSLNQTSMAEALIGRGAEVVVGWTGNVTVNDTDHNVLKLLELLLDKSYTVQGAVVEVNQNYPLNGTKLNYYPEEAGSHVIPTRKDVASLTLSQKVFPLFAFAYAVCWRGTEFMGVAAEYARAKATALSLVPSLYSSSWLRPREGY